MSPKPLRDVFRASLAWNASLSIRFTATYFIFAGVLFHVGRSPVHTHVNR